MSVCFFRSVDGKLFSEAWAVASGYPTDPGEGEPLFSMIGVDGPNLESSKYSYSYVTPLPHKGPNLFSGLER